MKDLLDNYFKYNVHVFKALNKITAKELSGNKGVMSCQIENLNTNVRIININTTRNLKLQGSFISELPEPEVQALIPHGNKLTLKYIKKKKPFM